jgi:hypothetical protein
MEDLEYKRRRIPNGEMEMPGSHSRCGGGRER